MFRRILIANRGEIAVRIMRTCRDLGIETVAVYSDADRRALHVLEADSAVYIGPSPASESYLRIDTVVQAAVDSGAEALHPGYGLLSENPALAEACAEAGIVFVGPPAQAIRTMGDKSAARDLAESVGVPTVPGYHGQEQTLDVLQAEAEKIGYPLMIKAALGGGGRGMRLVDSREELESAIESGSREAERAFGDGRLLLERAITGARHVEVQVLADSFGNVVQLGERDCSVQRRHQKVIEETPSPAVREDLRRRMGEAAIRLTEAVSYESAGTVELLLGADGEFYFLEMNTRLQVEHGVTELVTGLDIVALQLAIAAGERLPFQQDGITFNGHAIECRVYAEDPLKHYLPSAGRIATLELPTGEGIRNDAGTYEGDEISTYYDPLLGKVLVWGKDRGEALHRMEGALADYRVEGVHTNLPLLRAIVSHPEFRSGEATTEFLESRLSPEAMVPAPSEEALIAVFGALALGVGAGTDPWLTAGPRRAGSRLKIALRYEGVALTVEGQRVVGADQEWLVLVQDRERCVRFTTAGPQRLIAELDGMAWPAEVLRTSTGIDIGAAGRSWRFQWSAGERHLAAVDSHRQRGLTSPMPGLVLKVLVRPGEKVRAHQTLIVLEAMKMEHNIEAPYDGTVKNVNCAEGGRVAEGVVLIELEQETAR
ncbi:MAG TPA: acetyl-CoA carboxylase biotin carboxylase subunit [Dehalococcoidia bacterium]|nr:acetyl-CoA carboxylase biotin carboxylase subunit [Dehalococcoidia bacterium]